eukprot:8536411-Ditylum_brightwellii.AAC.1
MTVVQDPGHLYMVGEVVVMYDTWGKKQNTNEGCETDTSMKVEENISHKDKIPPQEKDIEIENVYSNDTARDVFTSDRTAQVLRLIEMDKRMRLDHLSTAYCSNI